MSNTTTIHITDLPGGGVMVHTTAGSPLPGQRLTPAQALATDLLSQCAHRASDVRYWHGKDKALALAQELVDPEGFAHSISAEVFKRAAQLLGMPRIHNAEAL